MKIPQNADPNITLEQIKSVLRRHSGNSQVLIYLPNGKMLKTEPSLWVEQTVPLRQQLMAILGQENVKM